MLIADDHPIVRCGLKELLVRRLERVECGEAASAEQVLTQVHRHPWDVLILDITMPGRSGLDILSDLKLLQPKLPVLVLSAHPEDQYAKRTLKAGARGYQRHHKQSRAPVLASEPRHRLASTFMERGNFPLTTLFENKGLTRSYRGMRRSFTACMSA